MNAPPDELDGAKVICFVVVTPAVKPTAATTHRRDGQVLQPARGLAICQYPGDSACYLFYCDENWAVRTDTFHLTSEDAKSQAEFEYEGIRKYWIDMA
ncbi:MAG: hypothetical protein C5B50_22640 [Verrucomicrobia bacterium]|nr:MAG: hypothetical protein C5B50_22640 [Verrucomicrobiota bacterium]